MKIVWVSANLLGFKLLEEVYSFIKENLTIITLSEKSKTIMYDGVDCSSWDEEFPNTDIIKVDRIEDSIDKIKDMNPDLIIMCGWRQIINKELLNIPKFGWVGFHPTLLPIGRGPAPIINSILNRLDESGLTMFYLTGGIDDGDIIGQEKFMISENDYAKDVYKKIILAGKVLVNKYIPILLENNVTRIKQNKSKVTYFEKPNFKDMELKSSDSIETKYRKIRAFSKPYKGAYIKDGNKKIRIWEASLDV